MADRRDDNPSATTNPRDRKAAETLEREKAWRRGESPAEEHRVPDFLCSSLVDYVREYAVFIIDPDGIIQLWGESARLMKWWTKEQAQGSHLRLLYPDGGAEDGTAEEHLQLAAERGEYTGEGRRVRSDGSTFIARVTLTALKDREGKVIGFAKVTRDFTAERAAEARVKEAIALAATEQRRAEEASHAKSLFVASVSHEVRSPVNSLLGYLQLMRREIAGPLPEPYRAQLARMEKIGNHLVGVLDDVLDQSRLESGRFEVRQSPGRLGTVIDSAMSMVEPLAAAKGLTLSNAVAEYGADVTYFGDEHRVRQILVNLLTNGIKFTPERGRVQISAGLAETPSPEAVLAAEGPWVYVRVEDNGPGIAPERVEAVFEPFERAEEKTPQGEGSGLGLSISRRLARLMHGDLTLRSEPGHGSQFLLWLPARDIVEDETAVVTTSD
jgi:PAS domain S-box-containing protein